MSVLANAGPQFDASMLVNPDTSVDAYTSAKVTTVADSMFIQYGENSSVGVTSWTWAPRLNTFNLRYAG